MPKHRLAVSPEEAAEGELPPHVVRIPLPLPLRDLRAVNVYAILVDTVRNLIG